MPRPSVPLARLCVLVAVLMAACSPTQPSGAPPSGIAPSIPADPAPALVLGCLSIEQAECAFVAEQVRAELPPARGAPFTIQVHLYGCPDGGPCPRSLAARSGLVTVEYADRAEPITASVAGPPDAPRFGEQGLGWLGISEPASPRVEGAGPFPYEVGHCGLTWKVDFDGSFWVPVGQLDGDDAAVIGNDSGQMRLLGPNHAEFRGDRGFVAQLARFPGPKHIWGCR